MNSSNRSSVKKGLRTITMSGVAAIVLATLAGGAGSAQASPIRSGTDRNLTVTAQYDPDGAGQYTCGGQELRTHLENRACGRDY
jgi:hypothetical protein